MNVTIFPLSDKDRQALQEFCRGVFLDGGCFAFALGLARNLQEAQMVGLMKGDVIRHVVVRLRKDYEGGYFDARGLVEEEDLGKPFSLEMPYALRDVTEEDLRAVGPVSDVTIESASKLAQAIWPQLPWIDPVEPKIRKFLEELLELSKKHGFFIRASIPGASPVIEPAMGNELGYKARLIMSGFGTVYTAERNLGLP